MNSEPILKPMSVARKEFISNLTDLINGCMLPPFIIEDVLKDTYHKICVIANKQLEDDTKRYQSALESAATKDVQT